MIVESAVCVIKYINWEGIDNGGLGESLSQAKCAWTVTQTIPDQVIISAKGVYWGVIWKSHCAKGIAP